MEALAAGDPVRVGPYRLVARLGSGGMGRVYLGRSELTGRAAAVKTIHAQLSADDEFRVRFSREAAAARRVRDEYIAEVLDADTESDMPWIATAYAAGVSVADAVRHCGPLPAESVRLLGVCVGRAVAAMHAAGLIHRDLKPGNVLLTGDGPKVIDFGIARGLEDAGLTRTGMVSGSPPYMAPEQLNAGRFGTGSDVFSLAAILHFAATGAGPYGRGGAQEQYARAIAAGPLVDPELPARLRPAIERCFAVVPEARPSAAELTTLLENSAQERPGEDWLPGTVLAEIVKQATRALNVESAGAAAVAAPSAPAAARTPAQAAAAPAAAPAAPAAPRYTPPDRNQPPRYTPPPRQAPGAPTPQDRVPGAQPQQPMIPRPTNPPSPPYQTPLPNRTPPQSSYPGGQGGAYPGQPGYPAGRYPGQSQGSYPGGYPGQGAQSHPGPPPGTPYASGPRPPQPYPGFGPTAPYGRAPYGPGYPTPPSNGLATAAMTVALVGIIIPGLPLVGLGLGIAARSKAKRTGVGIGRARTALIVSSIMIVLFILYLIGVNTTNGTTS